MFLATRTSQKTSLPHFRLDLKVSRHFERVDDDDGTTRRDKERQRDVAFVVASLVTVPFFRFRSIHIDENQRHDFDAFVFFLSPAGPVVERSRRDSMRR